VASVGVCGSRHRGNEHPGASEDMLERLCAMLKRLAGLGHGRTGPR